MYLDEMLATGIWPAATGLGWGSIKISFVQTGYNGGECPSFICVASIISIYEFTWIFCPWLWISVTQIYFDCVVVSIIPTEVCTDFLVNLHLRKIFMMPFSFFNKE